MRVHKWIRTFRERTRMSQRGFAKFIDVDGGNYSKYEMGHLLPGDDFLDKLKDACQLSEVEMELLLALRACDRMLRLAIQEDEK